MAATVVLATLLLLLSGGEPDQQVSESVTDTPLVQETFIEVLLDPVVVEAVDRAGEAASAALEDSMYEPPAEIQEPIGKDFEPLDQIEPMFVEEFELATDAEFVNVVPSPIAEELGIADVSATIAEPPPAAVEQSAGDDYVPTPEPVALPVESIEPDIAVEPEYVTGHDLDIVEETVFGPTVEFEEPTEQKAEALETVEPIVVENADQLDIDQPVIGPNSKFGEPVEAPVEETEPAVAEDAEIMTPPDENSNPVGNLLLDPFLAL